MRTILTCLFILLLSGAPCAAGNKEIATSEKDRCAVCRMYLSMFADWNSEVELDDDSRVVICGPKELFKYYHDPGKYNPSKSASRITALLVRDYTTKKKIDARSAYYVIWGDLYGPMGNEPIPFEKEADAKRFLKEHKGKKILRFNEVTPQVIHALDNPD